VITPHPTAARRRERGGRSIRRHERGKVARGGYRHCSPHCGEISRSNADPIVRSAPAGKTVVARRALIQDGRGPNPQRSAPRTAAQAGGAMAFRVSGKNIYIGEALRARISERIDELMTRYFDRGYSGHATVGKEGFGF